MSQITSTQILELGLKQGRHVLSLQNSISSGILPPYFYQLWHPPSLFLSPPTSSLSVIHASHCELPDSVYKCANVHTIRMDNPLRSKVQNVQGTLQQTADIFYFIMNTLRIIHTDPRLKSRIQP